MELRERLEAPAEAPKFRLEFLPKLLFGRGTTTDVNVGHPQVLREQQRAQMAELREIEGRLLELVKQDPRCNYGLITLRCGIRVTQALLDWAEDEIARLARDGNESRKEVGK